MLIAVLLAFLVVTAAVYQAGMSRLEGKSRTFLDSFEWATETISTTGYGSDNHWSHPLMIVLVIAVQFAGMILVPLLIAMFILPALAERFEQRLPREAPASVFDHVIVYRYGPAVETLLQRLSDRHIAVLVAETDEDQARAVLERKQNVVFSRSDDDILDVCRVGSARALVANGRDEENAGVILRARQMGFRGDVFAFVEDPSHRKPIELAGATAAYTPRHIVAAALAAHASNTLSPRLPGIDALDIVQRREIRVPAGSPLAGRTLGESGFGAATGATVVGQWCRSQVDTRCTAEMRVEPLSILEIVGDLDSLGKAAAFAGAPLLRNSGPFLIAGFGEVGRKVHELLRDAGEDVCVIERYPSEAVDFVGDVLDTSVLERARARESRAIILALNSDDATLFATVIARDVAPEVTVIARVNHARNLQNMHRAGADFALSISDVSGEMLSSRLLGRTARARDEHRRVVKMSARRWAGRRLEELPLRAHGCSAIAIEHDGVLIPRVAPHVALDASDQLWVCGTADALHRVA